MTSISVPPSSSTAATTLVTAACCNCGIANDSTFADLPAANFKLRLHQHHHFQSMACEHRSEHSAEPPGERV